MQEYLFPEEQGFAFPEGFIKTVMQGQGDGAPGANGGDLVFLCTPNNPTGRLIPLPQIRQVAEACMENGAILVLDECFIDFTEGASMVPELQKYPNLLILRAFTKTYAMAGLRLAASFRNAELLARIGVFGAAWKCPVNPAAGLAALQESGMEERTRDAHQAERAFLIKLWQSRGCMYARAMQLPAAQMRKSFVGAAPKERNPRAGLREFHRFG